MTTMHISDPQLLEMQIDALFTHDPNGRMRSINEPGGDPAPRFFLGRTRAGNKWRFRYDVPEDVVCRLEELAANEPVDDDLVRGIGPDWVDMAQEFEARESCFAVIEDSVAVSLCFSARLTARAAEAGVETVGVYRGRGYAATVVTAWACAVHATGRIPLYSTSWENLASQAVARKLRLIQYGVDLSLS